MRAPYPDMDPQATLILTASDVRALMDFSDYVIAVENGFKVYARGGAELPGVVHIHGRDGIFHVKAAGMELGRPYVAVKVNGNFPQNASRFGLPTVQGALILCEAERGRPLAFIDSGEITVHRTGAATALAARWLARPDSATATICGCGKQGRASLIALAHEFRLDRAYAYDNRPGVASTFALELSADLGINVMASDSLEESALQSDVIVTCTTSREPFLLKRHVRPGAFIAAVGADNPEKSEVEPGLLASSTVVVDMLEQCVSMGDLHHAIREGLMRESDVHAEIAEIVTGARPGRTSDEEIIVFDSTGTALQDVVAAAAVYEKAVRNGVGMRCNLTA